MWRGLLILIILAGCAPREVLVSMPDGVEPSETVRVFTVTNRAFEEGQILPKRGTVLTFTELEIAVPPDRVKGSISTPVERQPRPQTDFLLDSARLLEGETGFRRTLSAELRSRPPRAREVIIYVHGFNTTLPEGTLRMAQLMHDLDLQSVAVHFAWPSAAKPLAYERDRGSALYSRDALENLIRITRAAGAERVILVAHSMGAFLTMETLRQMAIARPGSVVRDIHGVVLISPDIDVDVFRTQAERIGALPGIFAIFISHRDRALRLSAQLTGESERLGNLRDMSRVADLRVTVINVSDFGDGRTPGHFLPGTSPELIEILSRATEVQGAFVGDPAGQTGLLPGTVLTVQNLTEVVLTR